MKRWISVVLVVLVAMSIGRLITDHLDPEEAAFAPFVREGHLGETVRLEYADVRVTGIRAGHYLDGAGDVVAAAGVFLVVDATLVAREGHVQFGELSFLDRKGRRFPAQDRASACSATTGAPTGARWHIMLCFDVPTDPELLVGSKLRVARGSTTIGALRRDDLAEIDLGIDLERAQELAASRLAFKGYLAGFDPIPTGPVPVPAAEEGS